MIETLQASCFAQIKESPEFAKVYLKTLVAKGLQLLSPFTQRQIDLDKLTPQQIQELALQVCSKTGGDRSGFRG